MAGAVCKTGGGIAGPHFARCKTRGGIPEMHFARCKSHGGVPDRILHAAISTAGIPHRKKHAAKSRAETVPVIPTYDSGALYDSGLCYADEPVVPVITTQQLKGRKYMAGNPVPNNDNDALATYPIANDGVTIGQLTGITITNGLITAVTVVP